MRKKQNQQARDARPSSPWTAAQAYVVAVIFLLVGLVAGYLFHGSAPDAAAAGPAVPEVAASAPRRAPSPQELAASAAKQAEPFLAKLKNNPNEPAVLVQLGNIYYDTQQYKDAITYYQRALKIRPYDPDVRADMATCFWYTGNADTSVAEFEKALQYKPDHAGALFNMGVVKWQGKLDPMGAVQAWEKLLQTHPDYRDKARVLELIGRAKQHSGVAGRMPASN